MGSKLIGCGSATPSLSVSNDDLSKIVETSDEWIAARTGIRNRRVLSGNETLRELSVQAAKKALEMAQVNADDVDLVLLCTSTPDDLFGGAAQVWLEICISIVLYCSSYRSHVFLLLLTKNIKRK
jgi:3-oxoacyl-[acyl-carrier-protein] synthase-3